MIIIKLAVILSIFCYKVDLYQLNDDFLDLILDNYEDDSIENRESHDNKITLNYIGQIGGLATDKKNNLAIFHRASRKWSFDSFLPNDQFNVNKYGAIKENVVDIIQTETLKNINSWGSGLFYMPHGLTIDHDGNYWLTDVALHQVFKFSPENLTVPNLILGERFKNGQDSTHFCKPTDVAVSSITSDIFVSDGYCNSRIVQFDKNGNYIREFKMPSDDKQIYVSHSIALIEDINLVCVADRENGRIVCFDIQNGDVKSIIEHPKMKRVFAIEYDKNNNLLYAVSGETKSIEPLGFTFNMDSGKVFGDLLNFWKPDDRSFVDPHDVTVSNDGLTLYTGELNGDINEFNLA